MSDTVISVENLSKRYTIRHVIGADEGLRHLIQELATVPLRWLRGKAERKGGDASFSLLSASPCTSDPMLDTPCSMAKPIEDFWALKDVSFEVKQGEVVGIIGRNGAGKSTLLKILSQITEPTAGRVRLHGRVASLLGVGAGFHPELTGRENIFVNGAVLGMTRQEIRRKFDEIVAFADIETFLDTPVKHYSSGMYVRLAFAVAAHLEPEILIVDEVLSVGDAVFQKKCLGKLGDVAKGGRTVVFVSHQMNQIRHLCEKCIWLDEGQVQRRGAPIEVIRAYSADLSSTSLVVNRSSQDRIAASRKNSLKYKPNRKVVGRFSSQ